jgi:hypothetical protein
MVAQLDSCVGAARLGDWGACEGGQAHRVVQVMDR